MCHCSTASNALLCTCQNPSELVEARHRDGSAMLGFQRAEVVEGGDAFAEVVGNLAKTNLQGIDDRLAGLSQ